jgi:hypothetical protein
MRHPSEEAEQHLKQLSIICFAILTGVVLFCGVVWYLVNPGGFTPSEGLPSYLATLLNLVALLLLFSAHLLPRLFRAPGSGSSEESHLAWHRGTTIGGFALREGAAIVALVGIIVSGKQVGGFAVAGLAVVTMVFSWPRLSQLQSGS